MASHDHTVASVAVSHDPLSDLLFGAGRQCKPDKLTNNEYLHEKIDSDLLHKRTAALGQMDVSALARRMKGMPAIDEPTPAVSKKSVEPKKKKAAKPQKTQTVAPPTPPMQAAAKLVKRENVGDLSADFGLGLGTTGDTFLQSAAPQEESDDETDEKLAVADAVKEGIFGAGGDEDEDDAPTNTVDSSGKDSELFGGLEAGGEDDTDTIDMTKGMEEFSVSKAVGAVGTGADDSLFTGGVDQALLASATEDSAAQLSVSDKKLDDLDLFVSNNTDTAAFSGAATTSQSVDLETCFSGTGAAVEGADDLFDMVSGAGGSGGGDVGTGFDFDSYISQNM